MHAIRRDGNSAVHGGIAPASTAMRRLKDAHSLSHWYCQSMTHLLGQERPEFHVPKRPAMESGVDSQVAAAETLEDQIEQRRRRTREALLLFANSEDQATITKRYRDELDGLDAVAAAAGESKVDAETMALIMALEHK